MNNHSTPLSNNIHRSANPPNVPSIRPFRMIVPLAITAVAAISSHGCARRIRLEASRHAKVTVIQLMRANATRPAANAEYIAQHAIAANHTISATIPRARPARRCGVLERVFAFG